MDRYRGGSSLLEIAGSFVESAEFVARSGAEPNNAQIVDSLYQNVLGRAGDQASQNLLDRASRRRRLTSRSRNCVLRISTNVTRTSTIAAFTTSQSKVVRLYSAAFGRIPDVAGFAFWADVARQRSSLTAIAAQFQASPEFTLRYGPDLDNEAFVRLLYANVLDRAPDSGGLAYWLAQLDTTLTRNQILVAFSESPENIDRTSTIR